MLEVRTIQGHVWLVYTSNNHEIVYSDITESDNINFQKACFRSAVL